ncbi:hypothetical protein ACQPZF_20365 [Actinosynnema sp. CS-041913]|uniref:hypothetical protein n=1 Tax=Actinosynnema sp. CS-041913 TaxID=3239917 RepID=UPI003D8E9A28
MNLRNTDRTPEQEVDPAELTWRIRLVVARLRERLTSAGNHGLFTALHDRTAARPAEDDQRRGPGR